jgi:hypothetical protein
MHEAKVINKSSIIDILYKEAIVLTLFLTLVMR